LLARETAIENDRGDELSPRGRFASTYRSGDQCVETLVYGGGPTKVGLSVLTRAERLGQPLGVSCRVNGRPPKYLGER